MVYPSFDPIKHSVEKHPNLLKVYRAIDWGYRTFVCLWIGMDKEKRVWVLDTYKAEDGTLKQHAEHILDHDKGREIIATFCDPAGRQTSDQTGKTNVQMLGEYGIRCLYRLDKRSTNIANGVKIVQNHLNPASGPPRLYYVRTPANKAFAIAMQSYENMKVNGVYIDKVKENQEYEHTPDALRYFFVNATQGPSSFDIPVGVS